MKNFFLIGALIVTVLGVAAYAQVQPNNVTLQQRNSTDTGYITRPLATPASGADGMIYYNGTTQLPGYVVLGGGLSIGSGILAATVTTAPVNADWNASSGLAQILNKPTIPTVTQFNYGAPNARTLSIATAYQATDPSKAAVVTVSPQCTNATTVIAASACTLTARVGTSGLTCSTGTVVATWTSTYTLGLLLTNASGSPIDIKLPIGGYFVLCATSGTFTINSAVDQSTG